MLGCVFFHPVFHIIADMCFYTFYCSGAILNSMLLGLASIAQLRVFIANARTISDSRTLIATNAIVICESKHATSDKLCAHHGMANFPPIRGVVFFHPYQIRRTSTEP